MEASVEAEETYRRAYELTRTRHASKSATVAFMANLPISFISANWRSYGGSGALDGH